MVVIDGCVLGRLMNVFGGDKDGEDVILEGDDSGVVSMVGNSGMSTLEYPLEALFILLNSFCVSVGVGKGSLCREGKHSLAVAQIKRFDEFGDTSKTLTYYLKFFYCGLKIKLERFKGPVSCQANDSNSYIATKLLPSSLLRTQTVENGMNEEFPLRILKLEMSSNEGLRNKYLDLPIYGSSDSPDSILICAQSSSLPKLFYRRSIKVWAFSKGILDVTCS
ncbi:hypothetical protein Tco_0428165 [Tanacetum coccineum]